MKNHEFCMPELSPKCECWDIDLPNNQWFDRRGDADYVTEK